MKSEKNWIFENHDLELRSLNKKPLTLKKLSTSNISVTGKNFLEVNTTCQRYVGCPLRPELSNTLTLVVRGHVLQNTFKTFDFGGEKNLLDYLLESSFFMLERVKLIQLAVR